MRFEKNHYKFKSSSSTNVRFKLCRCIMVLLSTCCNVDLYTLGDDYSNVHPTRQVPLYVAIRKWFKEKTFGTLSTIAFIFMAVHVSCIVYYQYVYDFVKVKVDRLNLLVNLTIINNISKHNRSSRNTLGKDILLVYRQDLIDNKLKLDKTASILQSLGAIHMDVKFVAECLYLTCLFITVSIYILPQMYIIFRGKLTYYFSRNFLIYERELTMFDKVIETQVDKYLVSSQNHVRALENVFNMDAKQICTSTLTNLKACSSLFGKEVTPFELDYGNYNENTKIDMISQSIEINYFLDNQLRYWNSQKLLRPFNRLPEWIEGWSMILLIYFANCLVYSLLFDLVVADLLFTQRGHWVLRGYSRAQMLTIFENLSFAIIIGISSIFHGTMYLFTCLDQISLIKKYDYLTRQNMVISRTKLRQIDKIRTKNIRELSNLIEHVNANLLYILISYKIFEIQLRHLKTPFALSLTTGLIILFAYPILGRVHLPYFESTNIDNDNHAQHTLMLMSLFIVPPFSLCVISICTHYHCCMRWFQTLAKYLAHIIDAEHYLDSIYQAKPQSSSSSEAEVGVRIYSLHLVSLLRKLVSHPQNLQQEFAIKSIGLRFTWANMLKVYFWFGLIAISIVTYQKQQISHTNFLGGSIVSILEDPFGLYN